MKRLNVFAVYRCGEIGKDLVSNFVSKSYPNNDVSAGDCRFRLIITSPSVCQVIWRKSVVLLHGVDYPSLIIMETPGSG